MIRNVIRTRFAPSPTGLLHLGHALAACEAFGYAAKHGGECLLRIEDIDHIRCKAEYTDAIYEDLQWLGCKWQQPVRIQSEHVSDYQHTLQTLKSRGLLYPCFLTRKELKQLKGLATNRVYNGPKTFLSEDETTARIAAGEKPAWRLSIAQCREILGVEFERLDFEDSGVRVAPAPFGDEVVARKDIGISYHLCAVHDDALQGITHIVRGEDIAPLTQFHVLLQKLMGWPTPIYHHHKLVMNKDGKKLAKRKADMAIRELRAGGIGPPQLLAMARGLD